MLCPYTEILSCSLMMVLAITCTFVVALNGLVAILVDSYTRAKVRETCGSVDGLHVASLTLVVHQEHAVVHRRREMAEMIVDYMSLLPKWKRNRIETQTQWFHARMEVGADGSLRPPRNVGEDVSAQSTGFNALRRDITKLSESSQDAHQKDLHKLKKELDLELSSIRDSVTDELALIADDLRELRNLRTTQATQC